MVLTNALAVGVTASKAYSTYIPRQCQREIRAAEKELGAFTRAVELLYGSKASREAAKLWMDKVETIYSSTLNRRPIWREVTISAASQLAEQVERLRAPGEGKP
ncbi:hypothetical protein BH10ACI4_BH10ACI4_33280 [soil metagenome]